MGTDSPRVLQGAGTLTGSDGLLCWEQHRLPYHLDCICPEMMLQNWFLLNILSLWKASIGCYFLLLLVSPYSGVVLMWADFVRSGGLNGVWLKSEHPTTTVSQFDFVGLFIWEFRMTPLASKKKKKTTQFFLAFFFFSHGLKRNKEKKPHCVCFSGNRSATVYQTKANPISLWPASQPY